MTEFTGVSYLNAKSRDEQQLRVANASIEPIREYAVNELAAMLQAMFDGVDDSLFELANSARTNNEQNRFFEAMREIRIKRKGIESSFIQAANSLFSPGSVLRKPVSGKNPDIYNLDSLTLVQNDDLEEDVAISSMATKAKANLQGSLLQFNTRIGQLYNSGLDEISPPLDPLVLSKCFAEACRCLELAIQERLIVYKQFDRYVMSNLERVFSGANRLLIQQGILPNLKTPGIKKTVTPKGESATTSNGSNHVTTQLAPDSVTSDRQTGSHTASDIFPHLQSLLSAIRQSGQTSSMNMASPSQHIAYVPVSPGELMSALSMIQNKAEQLISGQRNIDIRASIIEALAYQLPGGSKAQPQLSQIDEDLINLVSMLFEFILNDYNLAPSIQVLISRLQIPILKVVLQDRSFFNTNRHPARQLLNAMARAGIGWIEPQEPMNDVLYSTIHRFVHRILNEFNGDISLFSTLYEEFCEFIEREERKAKIVEQRTKESEVGRIRSRQAQIKVDTAINDLLKQYEPDVPAIIEQTLRNGWARVMFLAYLKDEKEHRWHKAVSVAEELAWCSIPPQSVKDRQKWISIVPKLLKDLKSGLKDVSYNTSTLDDTLNEIKTVLTSSFRNAAIVDTKETEAGKPEPSARMAKIESNPETQTAVERQQALKDHALEKYIELVEQLEPGAWVEFQQANGSRYRCKLSTKIDEADCYIFVNRMGLKTREKTKFELAEELRKKQARVLEQGLMIDRAMKALMSNLRQKALPRQ